MMRAIKEFLEKEYPSLTLTLVVFESSKPSSTLLKHRHRFNLNIGCIWIGEADVTYGGLEEFNLNIGCIWIGNIW